VKSTPKDTVDPPMLKLRLYVAGSSPNSAMAVANLKKLRQGPLGERLELQVVDVFKEPERALTEGVLVTPMLVKLDPLPECRILGNLSNTEAVLRALGFWEYSP